MMQAIFLLKQIYYIMPINNQKNMINEVFQESNIFYN